METPIVSKWANDPDLREISEFFLDEMPSFMQKLKDAADASDMSLLSRLAHDLKGSGPNAGFDILHEQARSLEQAVLADEIQDVRDMIGQIEDIMPRLSAGPSTPSDEQS